MNLVYVSKDIFQFSTSSSHGIRFLYTSLSSVSMKAFRSVTTSGSLCWEQSSYSCISVESVLLTDCLDVISSSI